MLKKTGKDDVKKSDEIRQKSIMTYAIIWRIIVASPWAAIGVVIVSRHFRLG